MNECPAVWKLKYSNAEIKVTFKLRFVAESQPSGFYDCINEIRERLCWRYTMVHSPFVKELPIVNELHELIAKRKGKELQSKVIANSSL